MATLLFYMVAMVTKTLNFVVIELPVEHKLQFLPHSFIDLIRQLVSNPGKQYSTCACSARSATPATSSLLDIISIATEYLSP